MRRRALIAGLLACLSASGATPAGSPGPFVPALRLVQRFGTAEAADPRRDESVKARLARALKDSTLNRDEMEGLMDASTFDRLAGGDGRLDAAEIARAAEAGLPESRGRLAPEVRAHADLLATSFDRIGAAHLDPGDALARWVAESYRPGQPLHVVVVCTGNSRRSLLGATLGNVAAAYAGLPEVRFSSGGTAPTAFNPRTIAALRAIGITIEPTGDEAPRGEPATANPRYRVRWGHDNAGSGFEAVEFSKHYADPANPRSGFAALMVCSEADAGCPVVKGAAIRVSMPYLDPKLFDDTPYEAVKYAERRDDIGRLLLSALIRARAEIDRHARP